MDYKKLYAVITYDCNLHCPHCDTRGQQFEFNEEKFLSEITRGYKEVTLFGGEPLLYKDRVKKCLSTGVVTALSTNLLLMNEEIQCLCLQSNVAISTSWNHGRFTPEQYQVGLRQLYRFSEEILVLITLTEDLFESNITQVLKDIDETHGAYGVLFEPLIGSSTALTSKADSWLCSLDWPYKMQNFTEQRIRNWQNKCDNVFTLQPNGTVIKGCTHRESIQRIKQCLTCEHSAVCIPCPKQTNCVFFPRYYELLQ